MKFTIQILTALFLLLAFKVEGSSLKALTPTGYVNDFAKILNHKQKEQIETKLRIHSENQGAEIVVVTLFSLEENSIESAARILFDSWKLGKKEHDNGVLLLIALSDKKIRIEVGYGLEEQVPDLIAGQIIRNRISPKFKFGQYSEGIETGVDALISRLSGEENLESLSKEDANDAFFPFGILLAIIVPLIAFFSETKTRAAIAMSSLVFLLFSGLISSLFHPEFLQDLICVFLRLSGVSALFYLALTSTCSENIVLMGNGSQAGARRGHYYSSGSSGGGFGGFGGGSGGGGGASGGW